MHNNRLVILGIAAFLSASSCNTSKHAKASRAPFASKPITIDGDDKDWPSPYPNYDSKAMISYAISNDRDNLYLSVKANDAKMRSKILRAGMTITIDTSGGSNEDLVIQSPMPDAIPQAERKQRQAEGASEGDGQQQRNAEAWRKQLMLGAEQYSLSGFGHCDGTFSGKEDSSSTCGIQIRVGVNEYNELVWEAAIPFTSWHHRPLIARDASKQLAICIKVAGVKMPARTVGGNGAPHGGGGGMHGGGGGMGGGGMRGGGRMGGGGGRGGGGMGRSAEDGTPISETTRTWLKTSLSLK